MASGPRLLSRNVALPPSLVHNFGVSPRHAVDSPPGAACRLGPPKLCAFALSGAEIESASAQAARGGGSPQPPKSAVVGRAGRGTIVGCANRQESRSGSIASCAGPCGAARSTSCGRAVGSRAYVAASMPEPMRARTSCRRPLTGAPSHANPPPAISACGCWKRRDYTCGCATIGISTRTVTRAATASSIGMTQSHPRRSPHRPCRGCCDRSIAVEVTRHSSSASSLRAAWA